MQDWGDMYKDILLKADLKITLLKDYVDNIRKACSLLKMGTKFDTTKNMFTWSQEWEEEERTLQMDGES